MPTSSRHGARLVAINILLIEILLKQGLLEERNSNYTIARSIYCEAIEKAKATKKLIDSNCVLLDDSKITILGVPCWALKYLHLKRSAINYLEGATNRSIYDTLGDSRSFGSVNICGVVFNSPVSIYKEGVYIDTIWKSLRVAC